MSVNNSSSSQDPSERRRTPRSFLFVLVPVYDTSDPGAEGRLNDISEQGLQVAGIQSEPGKSKTLIVRADGFVDVSSFQVTADCRWAQIDDQSGECVAGFQITSISDADLEELKKLIQLTAFGRT